MSSFLRIVAALVWLMIRATEKNRPITTSAVITVSSDNRKSPIDSATESRNAETSSTTFSA